MKPFLEHVATDLLRKHGTDLSHQVVVFPNKRASLFLNAHLARLSDRPIWSPRYLTISELFQQQSSRTVADPIKLVCELHRSFTAMTGTDETLDHFYGWGQLLISDFDDLDKCMADADRVLANLRDLHEMDSIDYLSEEQLKALQKFFSTFSPQHTTLLRERFLRLWSHMADIYHDFNERLAKQGLAYEGALYREVVENLDRTGERQPLSSPLLAGEGQGVGSYIFVGFNVLQQVEQRLFTWLKREGRARFYWDFDEYYMQSETGMFITQNLLLFPNELDRKDENIYHCFAQPKNITVASAPTENIQARYVAQWLNSHPAAPNHQTTKQPNDQTTKQPNDQTTKQPNHQTTKQPNDQTTKQPNDQISPDTAIVLCDEKLLPTVIHCLPDGVDRVNVTTGYPLSQTPVATLVATLFSLRTQGYQPNRDRYRLRQVNALLRHPYIAELSPQVTALHLELNEKKVYYPTPSQLCADEVTTLLFSPLQQPNNQTTKQPNNQTLDNAALLGWMSDVVRVVAKHPNDQTPKHPNDQTPKHPNDQGTFNIHTESLFRAYTLLNRLLTLVTAGDLQVDVITLQRLATQLMQTTTIPFHGEPVQGLQVMGVLETRCLDFSNVLMLSTGEGNLPKGVNDTSFIPYSLRKAYGLTTADHKVAVYSYYFHRLLQRAQDVTIVYNNATTDGHTGEMSRFVLQLMVEDSHHHIATRMLQAPQTFIPFRPQAVEKTPQMMQKLVFPLLTPTAINRYQRCPLQFYYTYVHDLREPDDTDDDTIDNRIFGNIFHEAARIVYARLTEKRRQILASDIDHLLRSGVDIERAVDQAIRQELFHLDTTKRPNDALNAQPSPPLPDLSGLQLINREVIIHYLRQLLTVDRQLAPFTIIGLETDVTMPFATRHLSTLIGGRIDRLDCIMKDGQEQIRVIDYKTGNHVPTPLSGVEAIFQQDQLANHSDYYLQTFLYSIIVSRQQMPTLNAVSPALLFIQHAGAKDYSPVLKFGKDYINDVAPYAEQFMSLLTQVIDEMFDPGTPFVPTADRTRCRNCPFRLLCC